MSNEATIQVTLQVKKGYINENYTENYRADITGEKGPVVGTIEIPLTGVAVDFAELTTPGLCMWKNIGRAVGTTETTDYIEYGIRDPGINVFYPLGVIRPGRAFVIEFTPNLLQEYTGTGTGTTGPGNYLWLKSSGAAQKLQIKAFES